MINSKTKDALIKFLYEHRNDIVDGVFSCAQVKFGEIDGLEPRETLELLKQWRNEGLINMPDSWIDTDCSEEQCASENCGGKGCADVQILAPLYDYLNTTFEQRESIENLHLELLCGEIRKLEKELKPSIWKKIQPILDAVSKIMTIINQ